MMDSMQGKIREANFTKRKYLDLLIVAKMAASHHSHFCCTNLVLWKSLLC